MSQLPPRAELLRVLTGLSEHLPDQMTGLLEAPRYDDERPAVERLRGEDWAREAVERMSEAEAAWMAELLVERWSRIAEVRLAPVAAITAPAEVWLSRPTTVPVSVVVEGLDEGWSVEWSGVADGENAAQATLAVGPETAAASIRVRIDGRASGARQLLVDVARVEVRVPRLTVDENRTRILVRDQGGRPASGVSVRIGETERLTDASGLVVLDQPAPVGAEVRVAGVRAGHITDEGSDR